MNRQLITILFSAFLLASCAVGKDYQRPEILVADKFVSESAEIEQIDFNASVNDQDFASWWKNFDDTVLNDLIAQALESNKDIAIAIERVNEVRAQKTVVEGSYYPQFSANASGERQGLSSKTTNNNNSAGQKERDFFSTGLEASWEIDIFGKTARAVEAASANIDFENEVKHGVLLSVTAELASNYFEVRGLQKQIEITKQNIALLGETEELATNRFEAGVVTELDVNRARGERQEFEAQLPLLEAQMMAGIYRISVLTGQAPEAQIAQLKEFEEVEFMADIVPVGLRSEVLRRRPDVRQAERNLAAQTSLSGVAEGALYPSFSIIGDVGSSASRVGDLFSAGSGFYTLGSIIDWDILQFGALRANINAAESREKQAGLNYEKAILLALEDVESALVQYGKEWQVLQRLRESAETRRKSQTIAKFRYEEGVDDFQTVLDAERALITIENRVVESETRILTYLTQVYKSLGGGWQVSD